MLRWFLAHLPRHRAGTPNRETRRQMARLSRPPGWRREIKTIARDLRPLDPECRERVLDCLPDDQAASIRWALRRS